MIQELKKFLFTDVLCRDYLQYVSSNTYMKVNRIRALHIVLRTAKYTDKLKIVIKKQFLEQWLP